MFGFTFARSNLASVRSEYNLLFAFLIVMSSQCSALSFVFTLSSALSHRLTRPWTCRNKLGPGWLDLSRLRKKMLNESNTPALLNSAVTLWDVFLMFSKSNFWGGRTVSVVLQLFVLWLGCDHVAMCECPLPTCFQNCSASTAPNPGSVGKKYSS